MHREPVFADPSGRRRRVMRRVGLAAAAALAACLVAVLVSMAGGPQAPFTRWADPATAVGPAGHHPRQHAAPSAGVSPGPTQRPRSGSSGASTATASPAPTNRAGKTPPGKSRPKPTKSPPAGGH